MSNNNIYTCQKYIKQQKQLEESFILYHIFWAKQTCLVQVVVLQLCPLDQNSDRSNHHFPIYLTSCLVQILMLFVNTFSPIQNQAISGADSEFKERGFICIKGWGFALLILSPFS